MKQKQDFQLMELNSLEPHPKRIENIMVVCGTHVHVEFLVNFVAKLYEKKCIGKIQQYCDVLFIINNSDSEEHFIEQCDDPERGKEFMALCDLLHRDCQLEVMFDNKSDYESSCFKYVQSHYTKSYDFMLFLQATTEFVNKRAFDLIFNNDDELFLDPYGFCCLVKIGMDTLERMRIPECGHKWGSIKFENWLMNFMKRRETFKYVFRSYDPIYRTNEIHQHGYIQEAFGRLNCIRENDMFIKYRGSWSKESTNRVIEEGKWN